MAKHSERSVALAHTKFNTSQSEVEECALGTCTCERILQLRAAFCNLRKASDSEPHFLSIPVPRPEQGRGIRDVQDALRLCIEMQSRNDYFGHFAHFPLAFHDAFELGRHLSPTEG